MICETRKSKQEEFKIALDENDFQQNKKIYSKNKLEVNIKTKMIKQTEINKALETKKNRNN